MCLQDTRASLSFLLVDVTGIEPATSWLQTKRYYLLSYTPKCRLPYLNCEPDVGGEIRASVRGLGEDPSRGRLLSY